MSAPARDEPGDRPVQQWTAPDAVPDARPTATTAEPQPERSSTLRRDALAAVVVAALSLVPAAPLGLLWAAVAPHPDVLVAGPGRAGYADAATKAFVGADATLLLLGGGVGVVVGALAWRFGRRHGPLLVVGLTVGGLLAAYVASRVGAVVGRGSYRAALAAGRPGTVRSSVRLLAREGVVGWPLGALAGFLVPALARRDEQAYG